MYILGSTLLYWILFTFLDTLGDTTNRIAILHSLLCGLQCLNNSNRLSSPILDITLQQSSLESVADAVAVEPISMIYIQLAGARLNWNFLVETFSISGMAHIYIECLHFVVKPISSRVVLKVKQFQFMQDIWLGQTLMKYDNIFLCLLKVDLREKTNP